MMQWIFPMAGNGERVQTRGPFKPFIKIAERQMLEWCLLGIRPLVKAEDILIFVTTKKFEIDFNVSDGIRNILNSLSMTNRRELVLADSTPPGPVATVSLALSLLQQNEPCISINCDQHTAFQIPAELKTAECFVPLYSSTDPKSSFVIIDNGLITKLVEKDPISSDATAGIYGFGSAALLQTAVSEELLHGTPLKGEFYMANALNRLAFRGIRILPIQTKYKFDLGDISSIEKFELCAASKKLDGKPI